MAADLSFVLVCQAGDLEIKASLLAASLRHQLGDRAEIIAAIPVPEERWGNLRPVTKTLLQTLSVRLCPIENRVDEGYGHANKVSAIGIGTEAAKTIFLDSDILCLKAPDPESFRAPFSAKPADLATWGETGEGWEGVYRLFGLDVPRRRVVTTISGRMSPPYFNAGVVAIDSDPSFAKCWEDSCIRIDRDAGIEDKRPWLDQIALPIVVARLGMDFRVLSDSHNFPAHLKPLPDTPPIFCHYHWPTVLRREPVLSGLVQQLASNYPQLDELVLSGGNEWRKVLEPQGLPSSPNRREQWFRRRSRKARPADTLNAIPEILITGIPRSGTSLLSRLIHDQPECVIVNEPAEIFGPLTDCDNPWWLACYYRELRQKILEREAIENKVVDGRLVEDTRELDRRVPYHPTVTRPDFLLGTKNTLVYLARISCLRRALPRAPIIACVRHPLDTIASWQASFPHLRDANLRDFPVSYSDKRFLTGEERRRLQEIVDTESPAQRRALLWAHLAETVETHRDSIVLVRYEELIQDTTTQMRRILSAVPGYQFPALDLPGLAPRSRRELLDEEDLQAASDLCGLQAAFFGYDI